jgi:prepilin-type N-terminal cleavage/methylation domain-containing protein
MERLKMQSSENHWNAQTKRTEAGRINPLVRRGLSLIELLVVMAIIALLVAITLVVTRGLVKAVNAMRGQACSVRMEAATV